MRFQALGKRPDLPQVACSGLRVLRAGQRSTNELTTQARKRGPEEEAPRVLQDQAHSTSRLPAGPPLALQRGREEAQNIGHQHQRARHRRDYAENAPQHGASRYRVSGTATPGKNFTLTPGMLDFAAGEATKTIPLTIIDDTVMESRETIVVVLRDPG
jgi:uncharacterized iron-regulated membrane protein